MLYLKKLDMFLSSGGKEEKNSNMAACLNDPLFATTV
jgi:hypothetical protein